MDINVSDFRIDELGGTVRLSCAVRSEGMPERLQYEVPAANAAALDADEPNWAAVALIFQAMMLGRRLVIEAALSPRLLTALQSDVQAALRLYEPRLKPVDVIAGTTPDPFSGPRGRRVATGFSAGVDSFTTIKLFGDDAPEGMRITDLSIFNVGAFGPTDDVADLQDLFRRRCADYAARRGWGTYFVSTNLNAFFQSSEPIFQRSHTLRNVSAALALQKEVGVYIYSAGMPYNEIGARPSVDMCVLDPILLPLVSTERLTFRSGGGGYSRGQKTALIADMPDPQEMLDVCVAVQEIRLKGPKLNCTRCWKCTRTLATLEALGKIDNFAAVFDLDYYRAHRMELLARIRKQADRGNLASLEALDMSSAAGLQVPPGPSQFRVAASGAKRWLTRR